MDVRFRKLCIATLDTLRELDVRYVIMFMCSLSITIRFAMMFMSALS